MIERVEFTGRSYTHIRSKIILWFKKNPNIVIHNIERFVTPSTQKQPTKMVYRVKFRRVR